MSELKALGYFVFQTPVLAEWLEFARTLIRAQIDPQPGGDWARLRLDRKAQRIVLESAAERAFAMGFEVQDGAALDQLVSRLEGLGITVNPSQESDRVRRAVERMMWFTDPDGNRLEAYCALADAPSSLRPSMPIGGFRTDDLGVGHIVLFTPRMDEMSDFYRAVLGFSLSDFCHEPFRAQFMHLNPRHHTVALIQSPKASIQHIMLEYLEWDDVGRAYDVILKTPEKIGQSLGRHSNDLMTSFYAYSPDRFMVELGWAGMLVTDDWEPQEIHGPSLWGHERFWLPEAARERARELLADFAVRGVRADLTPPTIEERRRQ